MGELELLTSANRNTLRKNIETLVKKGQLRQNGVGFARLQVDAPEPLQLDQRAGYRGQFIPQADQSG